MNLILAVSAVTCITMAHVRYYVPIQEIGVALAQTLQLVCPLGAFLAMRVRPVTATETAENI